MNIQSWIAVVFLGIGITAAVAEPPKDEHIPSKAGKIWEVRYVKNDLPNKLKCGAIRLKVYDVSTPTNGKGTLKGTLSIYDFDSTPQDVFYKTRRTVTLLGTYDTWGDNHSFGRVTFQLVQDDEKPESEEPWNHIVKGTWYTGTDHKDKKGNSGKIEKKGRDVDTIVLRFRDINTAKLCAEFKADALSKDDPKKMRELVASLLDDCDTPPDEDVLEETPLPPGNPNNPPAYPPTP